MWYENTENFPRKEVVMVELLRAYGRMLIIDTPNMDPAEWTCLTIFFIIVAIVTWICLRLIDDMMSAVEVIPEKSQKD